MTSAERHALATTMLERIVADIPRLAESYGLSPFQQTFLECLLGMELSCLQEDPGHMEEFMANLDPSGSENVGPRR